jgi:putative hemolysin
MEAPREVDGVLAHAPSLAGLPRIAERLLPLRQAHELYERARQFSSGSVLENLLREMDIDLQIDAADIGRIPKKGPVVVVANHPYGMLDGAVLAVLLSRVRPDVKILTNFLLEGVPELEQFCIFADPLGSSESPARNGRALRQSLEWLAKGGMLALFPAGEVSRWQLPQGTVVDAEWNTTAARLIQKTRASALPVYFPGHNSVRFQLAGILHPRLPLMFLLQEFLQQEGKEVELRVGSVIPGSSIAEITDARSATDYLRWRTYLLAERGKRRMHIPDALRSVLPQKPGKPIVAAVPAHLLSSELQQLPAGRRLVDAGEFEVYAAQGQEIPNLLQQIGRLREITFRAAGEGTGKSCDLDRFDEYYWHLLLWNKERQEVIGAYRAANTAEVVARHGIAGLYTSTLFHYDARLFPQMGPALELGRSFVCSEYQRQYAPLLHLWRAIGRFVSQRPATPVLFGAVSISNTYNHASRELIYSFFESRRPANGLAAWIKPRRPFRPGKLKKWDCRAVCSFLRDLDELSEPIADLEVDGKGLPILLRQYAKIGGKLLGFNVDPKFSDVLDGLIMVDLRETNCAVLERYMGKSEAAAFRRHHGLG